ncbi:MAG: DUF3488 and transglutaminase-like domain-containing protein [Pseudomonadota bacterium]
MTDSWDRHARPLLGAISMAALPHLFRVPYWLTAVVIIFSAMLFAAIQYHWPVPSRALKWLIIFSGVAAVKMSLGHIVGRDPGMALFLMMAFLKILEIRTERDRIISLCMAYFLLAANLFFYQSLIMAIHMLLSVWVTTAVMIHVQDSRPKWVQHFKESGALILQALPVMVVLFFLFPRIQGSLWGLPQGTSGTTGFTDRLSLGDVSAIVQNNEVAFRATFEQQAPPSEERYWRGIVFWQFDGVSWEHGHFWPPRKEMAARDRPATYTITLEPSNARWMFSLDMPGAPPSGSRMDADYTLRAASPIVERISYQVTSYRRYRTPPAPPWEIRRGLQLPDGNPRTVALGRQWAAKLSTPAEIVSEAVSYITAGHFIYTLNPPPPSPDPVDQFLFETKKGYCEHFAAAFALLMRAAGVPARVVGGYLGGEANPYGNYLIIRQSDAHAWVEIHDGTQGWVRIDPTALVAPDRVMQSLAQAVPTDELPAYLVMEGYGLTGKALRALRLSWDAVNLNWYRWVASYSHQRQAALLSRVGITMTSWRGAALSGLAAVALTTLIIGLIAFRAHRQLTPGEDPAVKAYKTFLKKAARAGLPPKALHDGPTHYGRHIARRRPDLAEDITAITDSYVRYRYGKTPSPADLNTLRRKARQFNPE